MNATARMDLQQARESLRKLEERIDEEIELTGAYDIGLEIERRALQERAGGWFVEEGIFEEFDAAQWDARSSRSGY